MNREKFYPRDENLGKECQFWRLQPEYLGCNFPNDKLRGRTGCEGIIDDTCLFMKNGRRSPTISEEEVIELKCTPPSGRNAY